jgi:hypothetical protein
MKKRPHFRNTPQSQASAATKPTETKRPDAGRHKRWCSLLRAEPLSPQPTAGAPVRHPDSGLFRVRTLALVAWVLASLVLSLGAAPGSRAADDGKIRVLIMSGGHDFETNQFFDMFRDNAAITFEAVTHPNAHRKLRPEAAKAFDVLVLYDMWQAITDEAKADLVDFLKSGKGLVSLHHSIANYQKWPEYGNILGGRYYLEKTLVDGVEKPPSTWKHDVRFKVRLADPQHPVTRGLEDFEIHDETYGRFDMAPNAHALLTTDEPTSARHIGWANTYRGTRVVYLQLGHDHFAYENPNYRRLVAQAIQWVAKKD